MNRLISFILFTLVFSFFGCTSTNPQKGQPLLPGKPEWHDMLEYTKKLHTKSTHPASYPFQYEWEELGPGYCYGPAFGHWDVVHEVMDALTYDKTHALHQLYNDIENQEPDGMVPGSIYMTGGKSQRKEVHWNKGTEGHPPVWVFAVDDYIKLTGTDSVLQSFYLALIRQITWFENNRRAVGEGFFYNDILLKKWESGVDEGIRFDDAGLGRWACVDATSHVFALYKFAEKWSKELGMDASYFAKRKAELGKFINDSLYDSSDKMYYDRWAIKDTSLQKLAFENFWPMITGAITKERANDLIDQYLLNPDHFLTPHPVSTVSRSSPKFELRMWRGPVWNSMSYWAARGCLNYDRPDAAKIILEKALDETAKVFEKTGTIWEFYDPFGGDQTKVQRKPHTPYNTPCTDYLGHNPLLAMAVMYDQIVAHSKD